MKTTAIIQARMKSTRLPGKVLLDIGGQSMLARVLRRIQRATLIDEVVVATVDEPASDLIEAQCRKLSVKFVRGSELDVLDRFHEAIKRYPADVIVRVPSDCPLIDPEIVDQVVAGRARNNVDYAANTLTRTYPRGQDTEAFTVSSLRQSWREAKEPYQRVHVTPYIYENPKMFSLYSVEGEQDYSSQRWTVDVPQDLELVRAIYKRFDNVDTFSWREVMSLVESESELAGLNAAVAHKATKEG